MPKLTADQETLLASLAAADQEWRNAQLTLEEEIRKAKMEKLGQLKVKRDLLAFHASEAKIPVTQISRRGLHTKATSTGYEAIANGANYAPKPVDPTADKPQEFAVVEPGRVRVTPPRDVVLPLFPLLGLDPVHAQAPDLLAADFLVDAADGIVSPITAAWNEDLGVRHPVVALVMGEDPAYRQRILEFAA